MQAQSAMTLLPRGERKWWRDVSLPEGAEVLLSSGPLNQEKLPTDTAVWLRLP
jgi:hypothetical protein